MTNEEQIKLDKIKEFALHLDELDEITPFTNKLNIFKILKTERAEIRHSNFLAWLLDVNESHGFGDKFIANFINEVIKLSDKDMFSVADWVLLNFSDERVIREWKDGSGSKNSLDILVEINNKNNKRLIAIENKVGSKESEDQTKKYREAIERIDKYKDYKKMYVFLTPDGENPKDDSWTLISYKEIKGIVENIIKNSQLEDKVKLVLEDYKKILEEITMENKELEEICTKIYKKYKDELNILYDYKFDDGAKMANYLKELFKELSKENDNIIYEDSFNSGVTYVRFATKYLNDVLGKAKNKSNCWRNNQRFLFEFHSREMNYKDDLGIFFTLTLNNNEDDSVAKERAKKIYAKVYGTNRSLPARTASLWKEIIQDNAMNIVNDVNAETKKEFKSKILAYVAKIEKRVEEALR